MKELLCSIPLFLTSTLSAAQEPLETLTVVGSRLAVPAEALPNEVTILEREAIEQRAGANTFDLLRESAGLHVVQTGGMGNVSSIFIRGGEPNFTTIMLDGVRVNDPTNSRGGSFNFSTLNIEEIERIEIIRGPQSARFGSDGLSGIINISTHRPPESSSVFLELGTRNLLRSGINAGHRFDTGQTISLSATTILDDGNIPGDNFENASVTAAFSGGETLSYRVNARYSDAKSQAFPEESGGPEFAVLRATDEREQELATVSAHLNYALSDTLEVQWLTSYLDQTETFISPGIAPGLLDPVPPNGSDSDFEKLTSTAHVLSRIGRQWQIVAGLDYQREEGDQQGYLEFAPDFQVPTDFRLDRQIWGSFVELHFAPNEQLAFTGSARYDDPDTRGAVTNLSFGVQYTFDHLRLHATWGEAYKLPSFFALGHGLIGNPSLNPETSSGWSVGVTYSSEERIELTAIAYETKYEDLIDFDFELFTNVNRQRVTAQGADLSANIKIHKFANIDLNLSYLDLDAEGTVLRQRPQWRGGAAATIAASENLHFRISWLRVGRTFDSSIATGGLWLESYDRLDARASWRISDSLKSWIAIDNAANEDYQEVIGFPAPEIRARIGLRYSF